MRKNMQCVSWLRCGGLLALCALALPACADEDGDAASTRSTRRDSATLDAGSGDASSRLAQPERPALCERDRADKVLDVFCANTPPTITGLADLQALLQTVPGVPPDGMSNLYGATAFVTMLGHSTALSGQRVSPLNPRMIVISDGLFMAFQRGVQKLEVIARARNSGFFDFYLIEFEQACNDKPEGCSPGDLYTPRVEQDWLRVNIRDDEDLKNTPNDCRQCHQRRGEEYPRLLMRELNNPWTHFFQPPPESPAYFVGPGIQGNDLLQDYFDAKGDERYGGFAPGQVVGIAPFLLEQSVTSDQPVLFDAPGIENERFPYDQERGYPEAPGDSPTWKEAWEAFKRGEQLALPFIEARVTDPDKHAQRTQAYQRYRAGELSEDELPDLGDIFSDDPRVRAQIGLQTDPDASAEEALIQACGSCHNDVLDQTLSRARFNVDLWKLDGAEISIAIDRIARAPGESGVMPPPEARQLGPEVRERVLDYLRRDPLALEPDTRLQRAAAMGMAGGKNRRALARR
jgi:mono/diheme cytochrome c family protein